MTFDKQWELEEQRTLLERLRKERPLWARRRRQRHTALATMALAVVVGVAIFNLQPSSPKGYDVVCCNRTAFPEAHWVEVAGNILTRQTI